MEDLNASEYLDLLQQIAKRNLVLSQPNDDFRGLGRMRAVQWDDPKLAALYEFEPELEELNVWVRTNLLEPLLQRALPSFVSDASSVPLGVLPMRSANAQVVKAPDGSPLVIMNMGLLHMVSFYLEVQQTIDYMFGSRGVRPTSELLEYQRHAYEFIVAYFDQAGTIPYPVYRLTLRPLGPRRMAVHMASCMAIEAFVLAHEYAHVQARHLDSAPAKNVRLGWKEDEKARFYQLRREQELEADQIAWDWYQKAWRAIPVIRDLPEEFAILAPLQFFPLIALIERNLHEVDPYSTHPPAVERLKSLALHLYSSRHMNAFGAASLLVETCVSCPTL